MTFLCVLCLLCRLFYSCIPVVLLETPESSLLRYICIQPPLSGPLQHSIWMSTVCSQDLPEYNMAVCRLSSYSSAHVLICHPYSLLPSVLWTWPTAHCQEHVCRTFSQQEHWIDSHPLGVLYCIFILFDYVQKCREMITSFTTGWHSGVCLFTLCLLAAHLLKSFRVVDMVLYECICRENFFFLRLADILGKTGMFIICLQVYHLTYI